MAQSPRNPVTSGSILVNGHRPVRNPGIQFMIPIVDRMRKVSLRTVTMPIQSQQVITALHEHLM